jgi:hypothetical protein
MVSTALDDDTDADADAVELILDIETGSNKWVGRGSFRLLLMVNTLARWRLALAFNAGLKKQCHPSAFCGFVYANSVSLY